MSYTPSMLRIVLKLLYWPVFLPFILGDVLLFLLRLPGLLFRPIAPPTLPRLKR